MTGNIDKALAEYRIAHELSPRKQTILEEQALILLVKGDIKKAVDMYRQSYELEPKNLKGKVNLAAALLYSGDNEGFKEIVNLKTLEPNSSLWHAVAANDVLFRLAYQKERYEIVDYILRARMVLSPQDLEIRTNLAALKNEQGDREGAIAVLRQAITDIPSFKAEGERLIKSLQTAE